MDNRPRLKLQLSPTDKMLEIFGGMSIVGIWSLALINYVELPETIPIHYNAAGEADGFGNKVNIFALPLVSTILFIGMTILNKYPHVFNYLKEITKDNAVHQYTFATRLIRYLKLTIVLIFGLIVIRTIQNANGNANGLGAWFLPLTLGLIFIPMIYFLIRGNRNKQ
ncbi:MAG: DUF1648 domain-containing protein [Aquaticitalea sp.]